MLCPLSRLQQGCKSVVGMRQEDVRVTPLPVSPAAGYGHACQQQVRPPVLPHGQRWLIYFSLGLPQPP